MIVPAVRFRTIFGAELNTRDAFTSLYEASIVPMLGALLRYLLLLDQGHGGAPEDVFSSDRVLQLLGVAWIAIYGFAVYAS